MSNVISIPPIKRSETVDELLDRAKTKNLRGVMVLGVDVEDDDWLVATGMTAGEAVILLERMKRRLVE